MTKVLVEYLYLDLEVCNRCIGTEKVLEETISEISPALKAAGYEIEFKKIEMTTPELAVEYRFLSSPTIRVNGNDIFQSVSENSCGCCSDISGCDVDCRVFDYNGSQYEVPPKEMLSEALLRSVFRPAASECSCSGCSCEDSYVIPDNLKSFYEGKNKSIDVKVLGSGCAKCNQLENAVREALKQLEISTEIRHVTDFVEIAEYGVMTTPALVINGNVVSSGKVLKTDEVIKIINNL